MAAGWLGEYCEVFKKAELYIDLALVADTGSGLIGDFFIIGIFKLF